MTKQGHIYRSSESTEGNCRIGLFWKRVPKLRLHRREGLFDIATNLISMGGTLSCLSPEYHNGLAVLYWRRQSFRYPSRKQFRV